MSHKKIVTSLPFSPKAVYDIIVDVKSYPKFVPYCVDVTVHRQMPDIIVATMHIMLDFFIKKSKFDYKSNIILQPEIYAVIISNASYDFFKNLNSAWHVKSSIFGSDIEYEISFELQNPLLNATISSLFVKHSQIMVEAFKRRAFQLLNEQ